MNIIRNLVEMKAILMKVHILIGRRKKHGHCDIERKQIIASRFDFVPCGIAIRTRDREMPANSGFLADEHAAVTPGEGAVIGQRTLNLNPAASDFLHFATIQKELPTRRTPRREGVSYRSRSNAMTATTIFRIRLNSFSESTTSKRTKNHLLSMKPEANPRWLAFGFVFDAPENMPPRKEVPPVYRYGWVLRGYTRTLNERTPPILQPLTEVA